jgi:hypothetical protein
MIDFSSKGLRNDCVCKKYENDLDECINRYTIREKGKSVKLVPRTGEQVITIILDNCLIDDNDTKCDALFLYQTGTKKYSFLVELKGAGDIKKAFKQLSYTANRRLSDNIKNRNQYRDIIDLFSNNSAVIEKFVIVSNRPIQPLEMQKLEKEYGIRVGKITHSEPRTPIPDLRDKI